MELDELDRHRNRMVRVAYANLARARTPSAAGRARRLVAARKAKRDERRIRIGPEVTWR